jgi:hypothetical protein
MELQKKVLSRQRHAKASGKLAQLGEAAPWVYKLMSHLYTSLVSALKMNKEFLEKSLPSFRALCEQINKKQFNTRHSELQREVCYAMKKAAKMSNNHKVVYHINETMLREELHLFNQALSTSPNIQFSTPIAFIIPRTPSASIFGDSSLLACGGYEILVASRFPSRDNIPDHATYTQQKGREIRINQLS